jgi:AraC-like DNA-binding protein
MTLRLADRYEAAAGLASAVGAYAESRGIDAEPIARACGLDPSRFEQMGERVKLDRLCRYMEALALISGDDLFGLKSASMFNKGASGTFGYALLNAPTMRDLLMFFGRNMRKISDVSMSTLEIGVRDVILEWTYSPLILHRDQFVDMTVGQSIAHLMPFLGPDMKHCRLELERRKPENVSLHKQLLGLKVDFGAAINRLIIPASYLSRTNPQADARLYAILVQQIEAVPSRPIETTDPVTSIRLHVVERLASGVPTLREEARRLGMSERTLQRRLTEAETSMHEIIDDSRREMAERLLSETSLSLSEISFRLGFSAPAAFTRSAIRWFGRTPSAHRKLCRDPASMPR